MTTQLRLKFHENNIFCQACTWLQQLKSFNLLHDCVKRRTRTITALEDPTRNKFEDGQQLGDARRGEEAQQLAVRDIVGKGRELEHLQVVGGREGDREDCWGKGIGRQGEIFSSLTLGRKRTVGRALRNVWRLHLDGRFRFPRIKKVACKFYFSSG